MSRRQAMILAMVLGGAACSHHAAPEPSAGPRRQGPVSESEARALEGTWTVSVDASGHTRTVRLVVERQDSLLHAVMDPTAGGGFEYDTELMQAPNGGESGWQPQPFWVHGDLLRVQFRSLEGGYLVLSIELADLRVLKGRLGECPAPTGARRTSVCYEGRFTANRM